MREDDVFSLFLFVYRKRKNRGVDLTVAGKYLTEIRGHTEKGECSEASYAPSNAIIVAFIIASAEEDSPGTHCFVLLVGERARQTIRVCR